MKDSPHTNGMRPEAREPGSSEPESTDLGKAGTENVHAESNNAKDRNPENNIETGEQVQKPVAESAAPEAEGEPALAVQKRPADPQDADDILSERVPGSEAADAAVLADSRRHTRRAFLLTGVGAAAGYGLYHLLGDAPQDGMQPLPLRKAFQANAAISRGVFQEHALAPTYPLGRAETLRINGLFGIKKELKPESYRLQVVGVQNASRHTRFTADVTAWKYEYTAHKTSEDPGHDTKEAPRQEGAGPSAPKPGEANHGPQKESSPKSGDGKSYSEKHDPAPTASMPAEKADVDENHTGRKPRGLEEAGESYSTLKPGTPGLLLGLGDITKLPRHELVTQFKCIEGWSQIVHWAGVRMADFLEAYPPAPIDGKEPRYVYMETPDGDYYVGYDLHVLRHPQTLLVTEMMGTPLTQLHGAPLRLHTPTKYGYKQIKRIGLIAYTNEKPDDYWTELGYDWYAGL